MGKTDKSSCCLSYLLSTVWLNILFQEIIQLGNIPKLTNAEYAVESHKSKAAPFRNCRSNIIVIIHWSFHLFVKYSYSDLTSCERMMTKAVNVLFEVWRFYDGWLFKCHLWGRLESYSLVYRMMMEFEFVWVVSSFMFYL